MSKQNPWELYQSVEGWEFASAALDTALAGALKVLDAHPHDLTSEATRAFQAVEHVMSKLADFGAMDTEPRWHLADEITRHLRVVHHSEVRVDGYGDVEGA